MSEYRNLVGFGLSAVLVAAPISAHDAPHAAQAVAVQDPDQDHGDQGGDRRGGVLGEPPAITGDEELVVPPAGPRPVHKPHLRQIERHGDDRGGDGVAREDPPVHEGGSGGGAMGLFGLAGGLLLLGYRRFAGGRRRGQ